MKSYLPTIVCLVLSVILIALKLFGVIKASWWIVTILLWLPVSIVVLLWAILIVAVFIYIITTNKEVNYR